MDPKERWYHIVKFYHIREKHFYDQRVYARMRKEMNRMGSNYANPLRKKYGLKKAEN